MLNKALQLHTKLFDAEAERAPIRNGFGEGLLDAGSEDDRIVGVCADLKESVRMHLFAEKFPERFIETGIMEQHMASLGAGLAAMGKIPFVASYSMFNPGRNWEQIRTTICYNNVPVKVVGSHSGVAVGPDGGSHQALEDIALMRVIPNMDVIVPADVHEAYRATRALVSTGRPAYLRLAREKTLVVTTKDTPFEIGKAYVLWESEHPEVTIIAIGPMVAEALLAARVLEKDGVGVSVLNTPTLKPFDEETVLQSVKKTKAVVTAETHQVAGGLGGIVAELCAREYPVPIEFVGVQNRFGQSGSSQELMKEYHLTADDIVTAVKAVKIRK